MPFRYVAPDFHGEMEDPGGSYTRRGSASHRHDYWIAGFDPASFEGELIREARHESGNCRQLRIG